MAKTEIYDFFETVYIYFLYDPTWKSQKFYVGKTKNPAERLRGHLSLKELKENNKKANWINALKSDGIDISMQVICLVPNYMTWQEAEKLWVDFIKWCNIELTNTGAPGYGPDSIDQSVRDKISKTLTGRICGEHNKEWNENIGNGIRSSVKSTKSSTGFKGVYYSKVKHTYQAQIRVEGSLYSVGCYNSAIEAAVAYDNACRIFFGNKVAFNFPNPDEISARVGIEPKIWHDLPYVTFNIPNENVGIHNGKSAIGRRKKTICKSKIGFKGVQLLKACKTNPYATYVSIKGKHYYVGVYDSIEKAAVAYDIVSRKLYGMDTSFNFPFPGETSARINIYSQEWTALPEVEVQYPEE
jgi:hypothetical protein